jgi:hypothetical protein
MRLDLVVDLCNWYIIPCQPQSAFIHLIVCFHIFHPPVLASALARTIRSSVP